MMAASTKVIGEGCAFISFAIVIGVLKDDDLVVGDVPGIEVGVGSGAGDPKSAAGIPAHLDGTGQVGELLLPRLPLVGLLGEEHQPAQVDRELGDDCEDGAGVEYVPEGAE